MEGIEMKDTNTLDPNTVALRSVTQFYDDRVENRSDLNTRLAQAAAHPPHHHTGIVREDEIVPNDEEAALVWLYNSENNLCDFLWQIILSLSRRSPRRLLDLGCGEGGTAARLHELSRGIEITGVSLSSQQVQMAEHACPRDRFLVGNMLTMDLQDTFDVVYSIEATEYLGPHGLENMMKRASSWLKPHGMLAIIAGSFASRLSELGMASSEIPEVKAFNQHYRTALSSSEDYLKRATEAGFRLAANIDLGKVTIPYWHTRLNHPCLRNSRDGNIEELILRGLEQGFAEFHLWAWYRG